MISDPIIKTLEKIVSLYGGIAEATEDNVLNTLLPDNVASVLSLPEEVIFSTKVDEPESVFVTYNSEVLNKLSSLLSAKGQICELGIKYDGYLKTTGYEKSIAEKFHVYNGLIHFLEAKASPTRYILCNVSYTANADEKRIGLVSFIINELTGLTPVEIGDALFWESDKIPVDVDDNTISMKSEELFSLIERQGVLQIEKALENWQAKITRARLRDEERLKSYYNTIIAEIQKRIKLRNLVDENKDKEIERVKATERELDRKILDIYERYSISIEAHLHSAMVIHLPTVHIQCELQRKKIKRVVTLVWNPFTKNIEPLHCELSGMPVYDFYLDDKTAKILSPLSWKNS